jgi:multidrug efflux pump
VTRGHSQHLWRQLAKENFEQGMDLVEATVHAAHQRLRPILMTSLAFVLGVLPLATASGAGSGCQNAIGTGVIGGMLAATFLAIFFVPLFFVVMLRLFRVTPRPRHELPVASLRDPSADLHRNGTANHRPELSDKI